jgi:hypothetical protein
MAAYSLDLRTRVLADWDGGMGARPGGAGSDAGGATRGAADDREPDDDLARAGSAADYR